MDRDAKICALYGSGLTLEAVGKSFGLTRERIRQIVTKHGILGGAVVARIERMKAAKVAAEEFRATAHLRSLEAYGCTVGEAKALGHGFKKTPAYYYHNQMRAAWRRGIEWKFTLTTWWEVWEESGKWKNRGRWAGNYVMARKNDSGPYSPSNVEIVTASENCKDIYKNRMRRNRG